MTLKTLQIVIVIITDVGRSCILVSMGEKNIMFDCGMHMGYSDEVLYVWVDMLQASNIYL